MKSPVPIADIFQAASQALRRHWGRAILTSLSMVVGTASLVLVVVTGISGRDYTLEQIRGVGTNLITIYHESVDSAAGKRSLADKLNLDDVRAIQTEIPGVQGVAPIVHSNPRITLQGTTYTVSLIGTTTAYRQVRNIRVLSGRFFDENDYSYRDRVCLITELLDRKLRQDPFYNGLIDIYGMQFKAVGVFRERVNTYGQTEVTDFSIVIPLSVMYYFKPNDIVDHIYASAESMKLVPEVSDEIRRLLTSRHRQQSLYKVDNLSNILNAANKISLGLTVVLLVIAAISLISSGISIMNVMLITVTERTREIGIKKSIGATRVVLLAEFLLEALILSGGGGLIGILIGTAIPYSIRFFTSEIQIQIPVAAVALGFGVTVLIGLTFGMVPALRAARMNPVEALRYE